MFSKIIKQDQELGYRSLTECVMDYLKAQLNSGELIPGDEIDLKALSDTLEISRTPIREALIQLVKDGFVELFSRKQFRIRKLSLDEIKDIYQVIGTLEAEAASVACAKISNDEIKKLGELHKRMADFLKTDDFKNYLDLNAKSHSIITQHCENPILLEIITKLKERLYDFPRILLNIPAWEKKLMDDHYKMIRYLKEKNKRALIKLIKHEHWNFSKNYPFILKYYKIFNFKNTNE